MLKNNGSVANIVQSQSTTSLLQALVNSRPKSQQKRVPSAKNTSIVQNKTTKRFDPRVSLPEPPKSNRISDSDKKPQPTKKYSLIQRTLQYKGIESQRIKDDIQQTVPDVDIPKSVTFFILSEQDQNQETPKQEIQKIESKSEQKQIDTKSNDIVKPALSKYVMRLSKGANIIKQTERKRMNSPTRRATKENLIPPTSTRKSDLKMRSVSPPNRKIILNNHPDFEYYMSFLRFFHGRKQQDFKQMFNQQKTLQYFQEIYQDHLQQSYNALQYCKDITKPIDISSKIINLPDNKYKKTIVFDLDETLIHCQESNDDPSDVVLTIKFPTGETVQAGINIRPYCREMLAILSQKYEIIVFTASHECYAQKVINFIDPDKKWIHHRFFRDSCVVVDDGLHIKDLRILGNRNLKDIVLIDNASYSFCFQLENGIPIIPFYDNVQDKELHYLTTYLLELMQEQDMLNKNASKFKSQIYQELSLQELQNTI